MSDMSKYDEAMRAYADQNQAVLDRTPDLTAEQEAQARQRVAQAGADFNGAETNPTVLKVALMTGGNPVAMIDMLADLRITTGLPAELTQAVMRQIDVNDAKARENEADYQKALAAAAAGTSFLAAWAASGAESGLMSEKSAEARGGTYSATNPPSAEQFAQMTAAERMAYFDSVQQMSVDAWKAQPQEVRDQTIANTELAAQADKRDASIRQAEIVENALIDERLGKTEAERGAAIEQVANHVAQWLKANPGKTLEDYADHLLCSKHGLSPAQMSYALEYAAATQGWDVAAEAEAAAKRAREAEDRKDHDGSKHETDTAIDRLKKQSDLMREKGAILDKKGHLLAAGAVAESDAAIQETKLADDRTGVARTAGTDNLAAGAEVDAAAMNKAELAAQDNSGFGAGEPAPQVAAAAARPPSIDIPTVTQAGRTGPVVSPDSPLLAQLGAPDAANSPAGPEISQTRPRVAERSQGMSA